MVDNGLGITLLPELALDGGILEGTRLVTRPIAGGAPQREIALVWRRGTGRREEFRLLAKEIAKREGRHPERR
jgi:LysR family hydrogen peroxide-inducible transcriptional activator